MEQKNLKKEKNKRLDKYFKYYASILLWIFIITIMITSIYILIDPLKFCKKTITFDERFSIESQDNIIDDGCEIISQEEMDENKNKILRYNIIAMICLIGMTVFNPDVKNKFKKFFDKIEKKKGDNEINK